MKRKASVLLFAIPALIFLLALPFTASTVLLSNSNVYEDTYLGGMKLKRDRLKSLEGKRIVFIGGSSLCFGLRSRLIAKELKDYEVVNFGLYGGLGSEAMLDLALPHLHEGDIAIISVEQNKQTLSSYFSPREMWKAIDNCKDAFFDLDSQDKKQMAADALSFSSEKSSYLLSGAKAEGDGVYAYSSFNEEGDIEVAEVSSNIMHRGLDFNHMVSYNFRIVEDSFIDSMNEFAKSAQNKGISTYFWFAPANSSAILDNSKIDSFYADLSNAITFPILGNPHDAIMDSSYFYDTNFHLNNAGSQNNSRRFVMDMKAELGDVSKTDIELLPPPEAEEEEEKEGNNGDLDCFEIREIDGEVLLTGLTELGKEKESIMVPYSYQGKVIHSFFHTLFQGESSIREVIIQDNIKSIPDGSFAGSKISRIKILNDSPSTISVGRGLLRGSSANIYVPWYALSKYRSNYFWSVYSDRLYEFR